MNDIAVRVTDLRKNYGSKQAVDGLSLSIERGEIFAILGPNGAGKTTTVEILEGYRKRTSGEVSVLGHDPRHPTREWRERIGIVLQSSNDETPLSAREYVAHVGTFYPNPRDTDEVLAAVGLSDIANQRSKTMSGGERRRLDVALGIIGRPELLFLDEPTTGFDPEARRDFWKLIESLKGDGTTIILTTHYLDEADYLADRVAIVNHGKLIALDTPHGLRGAKDGAIVSWEVRGKRHEKTTPAPTAFVRDLIAQHPDASGEVPGLSIRRPTLEDTYLDLIGHDVKDAS